MNYTTEFVSSVVADKFGDYSGPVMTDGYKSYDSVLAELKVPRAYCWSHARREFLPFESHDPTVKSILDLIDKLFEVERRAKSFKDTRVPMSNNEAERTIRHSGAATAATLYTIVESCKKNDLDPRTFILMSLQRAAQGAELETPLAFARRTRSSQDAD